AVEKGLGPSIVSTFDRPDRTLFARGRGTVTFGEFVGIDGKSLGMASVFTNTRNSDGTRTAICLFGSITNFTDYVPTDRASSWEGWTSSAAPYIDRFLNKDCRVGVEFMSREELASAALDVLLKQGSYQSGDRT